MVAGPEADDADRSARFPVEAIDALKEVGFVAALIPVEAGESGIAGNQRESPYSLDRIVHGAYGRIVMAKNDRYVNLNCSRPASNSKPVARQRNESAGIADRGLRLRSAPIVDVRIGRIRLGA